MDRTSPACRGAESGGNRGDPAGLILSSLAPAAGPDRTDLTVWDCHNLRNLIRNLDQSIYAFVKLVELAKSYSAISIFAIIICFS